MMMEEVLLGGSGEKVDNAYEIGDQSGTKS